MSPHAGESEPQILESSWSFMVAAELVRMLGSRPRSPDDLPIVKSIVLEGPDQLAFIHSRPLEHALWGLRLAAGYRVQSEWDFPALQAGKLLHESHLNSLAKDVLLLMEEPRQDSDFSPADQGGVRWLEFS
jgi:hypothetical protein